MESYQRSHPRVFASLPVQLELADGRTVHAITVNLSRAGFQIETDAQVRTLLFPDGDQPVPRSRVPVTARLMLEVPGDRRQPLELACVAVFARRTAERRYQVGLAFTDLSDADGVAVDRLLDGG